jgi:hypothetical protein
MAFTDNCDLYGAVHEQGVNRVIQHLMLQRPSMFNYATADVAGNKELWCEQVKYTADVTKYGNPIFTVLPPLPVIGVDSPPVGLSYCIQLVKFELDFYPNNIISLPPELRPMNEQRFAFHFVVCGALGCPDDRVLEQIPVIPSGTNINATVGLPEKVPPVHIPGKLECFCLEVFVVGHFERAFILGREVLLGKVDGVEIVDIKPDQLENSIECYIKTAVTLTLRQKLAIPLATFFVSFPLFGMGTVTLSPTPNPPVPNNPAIEEDQLKVFINMTVL